jgi:hypothetical protein
VHPEDRIVVEEAFQNLLKTGKFSGEGARIVCPDGSMRYIQLQGVGSFDAAGNVQHLNGTIRT